MCAGMFIGTHGMTLFPSVTKLPRALTLLGVARGMSRRQIVCRSIVTPYAFEFTLPIKWIGSDIAIRERSVLAGMGFVSGLLAVLICAVALLVTEGDVRKYFLSVKMDDPFILCIYAAIALAIPVVRLGVHSRTVVFDRHAKCVTVVYRKSLLSVVSTSYSFGQVDIVLCSMVTVASATAVGEKIGLIAVMDDQAIVLGMHSKSEVMHKYMKAIESNTGIMVRATNNTIIVPAFWIPFVSYMKRVKNAK